MTDATDEAAFQAHLDARPDDHGTRMVFADLLQDRDDPRAEGYRALGALQLWPGKSPQFPFWWSHTDCPWVEEEQYHGRLPLDWFRATREYEWLSRWCDFPNRRAAEDAAALAWLKLTGEQRAEILSPVEAA